MEAYDAINENIRAGPQCRRLRDRPFRRRQRHPAAEPGGRQGAGRRAADGDQHSDDEVAWRWLAINPAKALGIADQTGSLEAGKMADVVLWNGNPFSVYTRPAEGLDRRRAALRHERSARCGRSATSSSASPAKET